MILVEEQEVFQLDTNYINVNPRHNSIFSSYEDKAK